MRVLLTGARAPATLELARLCARAGHTVHVADSMGWHVCRASRHVTAVHRLPAPRHSRAAYAAAVRSLVVRCGIEVIVPTCEEVFHLAAVRDRLGAPLACEPLERLAMLHDKWRFIAACHEAGVAAPPTTLLDCVADLASLPDGAYMLKPRYSRFATRVAPWATGELTDHLGPLTPQQWIAQERVHGTMLCSWSVAVRGRVHAHVTYQPDATAGAFGAAIAFHSVRHAGVLAWVHQFVAHHGLSGQLAFDFIDAPGGVQAIECNPRLTSGVHCFRDMPHVVRTLLDPDASAPADPVEPAPHRAFRSALALLVYGARRRSGAGLLDAADDPWPRRLQGLTWAHLLLSSLGAGMEPRRWSTHDIEWNGE